VEASQPLPDGRCLSLANNLSSRKENGHQRARSRPQLRKDLEKEDALMPDFFKPLTWSANWIKRRHLQAGEIPCALASCTGQQSRWQRFRKIHRPTGTFLQDVFYCQPQCLETALIGQLSRLRTMAPSPQSPNRIPLGLLMVARGKVTYLEVRAALEAQRRARYGKIGEWIEKLGFATEQEVTTALGLQWGCPVASSFDPSAVQSPTSIPLPILEAFQMLPINYVAATNTLCLAFGERVDHGALYAIEKILDCRTQPCVAGRKTIARQLDSMRQLPRPCDVEFGPMSDLAEMARIASSYTSRLSPEQVRISRIGRFIWLRLDVRSSARLHLRFAAQSKLRSPSLMTTNLVFRLSTDSPRPLPFTRNEHPQRAPLTP
jgi:Type II secretion system (T2SS), protein E, N-terminal domain